MNIYRKYWFNLFSQSYAFFELRNLPKIKVTTCFLSDCQSLIIMIGIAIPCIQHSQAMLERGICELAHSFFHFYKKISAKSSVFPYIFHIKKAILDTYFEIAPVSLQSLWGLFVFFHINILGILHMRKFKKIRQELLIRFLIWIDISN